MTAEAPFESNETNMLADYDSLIHSGLVLVGGGGMLLTGPRPGQKRGRDVGRDGAK